MNSFLTATERAIVLVFIVIVIVIGVVFAFWFRVAFKPIQQAMPETRQGMSREQSEMEARIAKDPIVRQRQEAVDQIARPVLEEAQNASQAIADFLAQRRRDFRAHGLKIPNREAQPTQKQAAGEYLKYRLRELDAYRRITDDQGAAKEAGEKFIDAYVRFTTTHEGNNYDKLKALGNAAIDAGSHDPMLRTYHGLTLWILEGNRQACERIWKEALEDLRKTKYPVKTQLYANLFLNDLIKSDPTANNSSHWPSVVDSFVRWLEEEAEDPAWLGSVCRRFWDLWHDTPNWDRELLLKACLQSQKIDPYIKQMLAGAYYYDVAWLFRGHDFAPKLTVEQVTQFEKYLKIASTHLMFAWKLHPELPHAPCDLIGVAMSDPSIADERPYFWFVQTVEARFDFEAAYSRLLNSLLPRWGGSHEKMLQFGRSCIETDRFETIVPSFAIDVLEKLFHWENVALPQNAPAMKLLQDFVARKEAYRLQHPDLTDIDNNPGRNSRTCLMLEYCNLLDAAANEVRMNWKKMNWSELRYQGRLGRYLSSRLVAAQGQNRQSVMEFDEKLRQPWDASKDDRLVSELEEQAQKIKETKLEDSDALQAYFRHVDAILSQLRGLTKGEWVPLPITRDLDGFEPYCDQWFVSSDQAVELSGRNKVVPQICLRPLANFYPPLEVEATLELLDPDPYPQNAGIGWSREVMLTFSDCLPNQPSFGVGAFRDQRPPSKEKIRRDDAWAKTGSTYIVGRNAIAPSIPHQLRLKLWPNRGEFRVDDRSWITAKMPNGLHPQGWLCFGSNVPEGTGALTVDKGIMRWSNLRVRRLDLASPPDQSEPLESRAEYWIQRLVQDPDDPIAASELCAIRLEQKRFDEVIEVANQMLARLPQINGLARWKAIALYDSHRDYKQALKEFQALANTNVDDYDVYAGIVEIQAAAPDESFRNGQAAKLTGEMFVRITGTKYPRLVSALAAAHAELEEFDDAIKVQQDALKSANEDQAKDWEQRLQLYRDHKPYRLPENDVTR